MWKWSVANGSPERIINRNRNGYFDEEQKIIQISVYTNQYNPQDWFLDTDGYIYGMGYNYGNTIDKNTPNSHIVSYPIKQNEQHGISKKLARFHIKKHHDVNVCFAPRRSGCCLGYYI